MTANFNEGPAPGSETDPAIPTDFHFKSRYPACLIPISAPDFFSNTVQRIMI
jgi:hypothetical protein